MGCRNPCTKRLGNEIPRLLACFLCPNEKYQTPDSIYGVRRDANILNKHTILCDCFEPPDHIVIDARWFSF